MGFYAPLTCSTLQCLNLTAQLQNTFQKRNPPDAHVKFILKCKIIGLS